MPARFLQGDLFRHERLRTIGHGVNCAGAMGKGVALEVRRRFPLLYAEYRKLCLSSSPGSPSLHPGDVFVFREDGWTVFNLATQKSYRTGATLEAIHRSLITMLKFAGEADLRQIGLPRLGAGLGGLSWYPVRQLLEDLGAKTTIELLVFEDYVPGVDSPPDAG